MAQKIMTDLQTKTPVVLDTEFFGPPTPAIPAPPVPAPGK
jgi:hypothetical protein